MEEIKQKRQKIVSNENNQTRSMSDLDSSSKKCVTYFENLSNEIIYEIFEFLDYCHIYEAFFNLNGRLQNLLIHSSLPINIDLSFISKKTFEHYCTNIIIPYQHRIKSLHLSYPIMINRIFLSAVTPISFTRLEKLILIDYNPIFLSELLLHLASFSCIHSLVIKCVDVGRVTNNFYLDLFGLPTLKYCKISCNHCVSHKRLPFATIGLSPIEYLVIDDHVYPDEINTLLSYVPQLRRLILHHLNQDYNSQVILRPIILNQLTHVSLNLENIPFHQFESMVINLFNQVQILYISVNNDIEYLDANRWEQLIVSYMPYLRIFDIASFYYLRFVPPNFLHCITLTEKFNSFFWIERQWFFEHQIHEHMNQNYMYFYSTNPYRRKSFILCGEKAENIHIQNAENCMDSVDHVEVRDENVMITCRNYFPNITRLTISIQSINGNGHFLSTNLNRILSLRKLTKLTITAVLGSFIDVIELLSYTPNIHTLDIKFASYTTDLLSLQQNENFQLLSKTNNIRKMTISCDNMVKVTTFLVTLCLRLENLTINASVENLKLILPFLLSKYNNHSRSLTSLSINVLQAEIDPLITSIAAKKLADRFMITIIKVSLKNKFICFA